MECVKGLPLLLETPAAKDIRRHDARVVSIHHPPDSTPCSFQYNYRVKLPRLLFKMGKVYEYARVFSELL